MVSPARYLHATIRGRSERPAPWPNSTRHRQLPDDALETSIQKKQKRPPQLNVGVTVWLSPYADA